MSKKMTFRISVSVEGYESKDVAQQCVSNGEAVREKRREVTKFREVELDLNDYLESVTTGHTVCGLYKHKMGCNFTARTKNSKNYKGSQLVFIDIDETRFETMVDYIDVLSYPPTCGYYSFNDKDVAGGRRFRLVYVLDKVYDWTTIRSVYLRLAMQAQCDTDEKIKDNCGGSPEQCFFGTCYRDTWKDANNIYSPEDIELIGCEEAQEGIKQAIREPVPTIDEQFIKDVKRMSYKQFIYSYYADKGYRNFWQSQYASDEGRFWTYTDEGYVKLFTNREVITDGHKRRKKLFMRMCLRRLAKPTATIEEILYCAIIDREQFIDNSDGVVSIDCLIRNAKNAFTMSLEQIRKKYQASVDYCSANRPKSVINDDVPNKRAMVPVMTKERNDLAIGSMYDTSKSFTDNLADMTACGVKLKERRLKKWCYDNGIEVPRKQSDKQKAAKERNEELIKRYDLALTGQQNADALGVSTAMAHRIKHLKLNACHNA